nr:MAG TPA: hypothetical protein [Caudoviricetes sp.]
MQNIALTIVKAACKINFLCAAFIFMNQFI